MIEVKLSNGQTAQFPDGTPPEAIKAALQKLSGRIGRNQDGTYGTPPEGMFANPQTGQMTNRELLQRNANPSQLEAAGQGYMQGYTYGGADELAGVAGRVEGGPDMQRFRQEQMRAERDAARQNFPITTGASEFAGAVLSPASKLGQAQSIVGAIIKGAGLGGAYAGLAADENRGAAASEGAQFGALIGGASQAAINFGSAAFRRLYRRTAQRPTLEGLRATKNVAYKAVDDAGETFQPAELQGMVQRLKAAVDDLNFVPEVDKQTQAALDILERRSGTPLTMGQLDKIRQSLWKRANAAPNEPGVRAAIDAIDEMILNRADTSELMTAARAAHARFKKAELLERAFKKAEDQTASTGSGGNILNKYRQAVTSIVNNPRQAKWFSRDELAAMEKFIHGSFTENQLRRIGKLSPSGNGLMLALNLGAVSVEPSMLAATAVGAGAKAAADRMSQGGRTAVIDAVTGYSAPKPISVPTASGGAVLQEQIRRYLESGGSPS